MREVVSSFVVASFALAGLGVVQAVRGWPGAPPGAEFVDRTARAAPLAAAAPGPVMRRLTPVISSDRDSVARVRQLQLQNLLPNTLVLDLDSLEDMDAGLVLVRSWHDRHGHDQALDCWLTARDPAAAWAAAAMLAREACSSLRVAA